MKLWLLSLALFVSTPAWAGQPAGQAGTGDAKAHYERAEALYKKGDVDGAIAEYREAIRLEPDYAEAHNDLGYVLYGKGDVDGAIAEYRAAIRLKPDLVLPHTNLGIALGRKGDVDGAIAALGIRGPSLGKAADLKSGGLRYRAEGNLQVPQEKTGVD